MFSCMIQKALRYREVKDQFELVPHPGILVEEGFLPAEEEKDSDATDGNSGSMGSSSGNDDEESSKDIESSEGS